MWASSLPARRRRPTGRFASAFSGPAAANFANFVPKTINAMIYVKKPSYGARVGWNYTSRRRATAVTGRGIEDGTFNWTAPRLYCDVELQYFLTPESDVVCDVSQHTGQAAGR